MAWCTEIQVRNSNKKFSKTDEVLRTTILDRISAAESMVEMDLSSVISGTELAVLGATSKAINLLTLFKSVELTLVTYYGAGRKIDEVSDIKYFQDEYKKLLDKILAGDISLSNAAVDYTPKSYPAVGGGSNKKFYVRKGIDGFIAEGETQYGDTTVDDSIKS
jgi:hypothetical protein